MDLGPSPSYAVLPNDPERLITDIRPAATLVSSGEDRIRIQGLQWIGEVDGEVPLGEDNPMTHTRTAVRTAISHMGTH